ncbi:MAG: protein phosphatase [Candidatus Hepatoplasma scabrum]|nr:MAG: protein phosphatase [Candidatus Hepatoplasma sp.]
MKFNFAGRTVKGVRVENQDNYTVFLAKNKSYFVAAIADGMGGYRGGKLASEVTINFIERDFKDLNLEYKTDNDIFNLMIKEIRLIQLKLINLVKKENAPFNMGTTINFNLIYKNKIYTLNIGDTRSTNYYQKELKDISEDHNLAALAKKNKSFRKYYKYTNYLTSALGPKKESILDIFITNIKQKGILIVASDGIHNFVKTKELLKILKTDISLSKKVDKIISRAMKNQSNDNMTCVLVEYGV